MTESPDRPEEDDTLDAVEIDDVEEPEAEHEESGGQDLGGYEPGPEPGAEEEVPCACCGEPHPAGAVRCRSCTGFLPIIEQTVHKEHFFFLFCMVALFLGTLLNWESKVYLPGSYSILGGLLLVVSAYGVFASLLNVFHRRMIVWPHMTAMILGLWAGWQRVIQLLKNSQIPSPPKGADFSHYKKYIDAILHLFGPGLYIVVPVSTALIIFLIVSIFVAGRRDAQRKAAMRTERASSRGESRRRR